MIPDVIDIIINKGPEHIVSNAKNNENDIYY